MRLSSLVDQWVVTGEFADSTARKYSSSLKNFFRAMVAHGLSDEMQEHVILQVNEFFSTYSLDLAERTGKRLRTTINRFVSWLTTETLVECGSAASTTQAGTEEQLPSRVTIQDLLRVANKSAAMAATSSGNTGEGEAQDGDQPIGLPNGQSSMGDRTSFDERCLPDTNEHYVRQQPKPSAVPSRSDGCHAQNHREPQTGLALPSWPGFIIGRQHEVAETQHVAGETPQQAVEAQALTYRMRRVPDQRCTCVSTSVRVCLVPSGTRLVPNAERRHRRQPGGIPLVPSAHWRSSRAVFAERGGTYGADSRGPPAGAKFSSRHSELGG